MKFKVAFSVLAISLALNSSALLAKETNTGVVIPPLAKSLTQYHSWVEISQPAFQHNIETMQRYLNAKSRLCAVMKADAYGHGIGLLMPQVIKSGVNCIGITSNEEAQAVRASGYKGQLMRLRTATLGEVEAGLPFHIEELVGNLAHAQQVAAIAARHHRTIAIHLGLNAAGMSRNGLDVSTEQGKQDAIAITRLAKLHLVGIMTHFPVEEKEDVRQNLAKFNQQSAWLIQAAGLDRSKLILHAANSFATLEVPESQLDMVRVGGALYGDTVPSHTEYQRVMQFKSAVASVNAYPAGNTVGYDKTYTLKRDSLLANIPVGYSDGYRRVFTNKAFVLIDGKRAPVVGKVSMNTLMVDVTDIPNVKMEDEVVLFGKQGNEEISQAELEDINGALLADLYTIWGNSNHKVLVK